MFFSHFFVSLDQIPKIKIFYMVASDHTEVIEGRQWLITTYIPKFELDGPNYDDVAASYEEDDSGLGEVGVSMGVNELGTE